MIKILQDHLQKHPSIAKVYLNAAGNWQFHPRPSHPIVKTRDEVLAMQEEAQTGAAAEPAKGKKIKAPAAPPAPEPEPEKEAEEAQTGAAAEPAKESTEPETAKTE